MSDLVRFGVAMDRALLTEFDRRIAALGYENRSEAIRDLVRADLTRAAWDRGAPVVATLSVVYKPHVRAEVLRLSEPEPGSAELVVASQHVRIDRDRYLDTMVLRGHAESLSALAGKIAGTKGVLSCELHVAASVADETRPNDVQASPSRDRDREQEQG
ncbi:nickel-responsive transcriptional regulator NikR [Polyangium jinanense]|uniref:Putative nickel-responsive regulator n=1 Tax=Polyangium jinanense TaxID=2829994 RepID=A0A9X3X6I5_9BACT|nr:nickel-responsive transcriptional regulator NikR [Polyangium jinanense]MDC3957967.1 nickel-responsive transcriptional regulator NikR [Polyangium jinanense]MDC3983520.1 nickel-responsive transcriptional regulator NikR [Polyangium jinanense]